MAPGGTPRRLDRRNVIVDLNKIFGRRENCVAYLRAVVFSPRACRARLEIGSDDGVKVWLNGIQVHATDEGRPLTLGEDTASIQLEQGANGLLVKIVQFGGDWSTAFRVCAGNGGPLHGVYAEMAGKKQMLWAE